MASEKLETSSTIVSEEGTANMLNKPLALTALLWFLAFPNFIDESKAADPLAVTSPDGNLTISVALKALPRPYLLCSCNG